MSRPFQKTERSSKRRGFLVTLLVGLVGGVLLASAASAHHPEIAGASDCDGSISFTSTAWQGANVAERTNPSIEIAFAVDGGSYTPLPADAAYRYDSGNGFAFSDSFMPPAGWSSVTLSATATGAWGNGVAPGDSRTSGLITPQTDCEPVAVPAAAIADATCVDGGSVVQMSNPGDAPVVFTISAPGRADVVTTVPAGGTSDVVVSTTEGFSTPITVSAPGMPSVTEQVTYACAAQTETVAVPGGGPDGGGPDGGPVGRGPTAEVVTRSTGAPLSELPRTGPASMVLLLVALMSITLGAATLRWSS